LIRCRYVLVAFDGDSIFAAAQEVKLGVVSFVFSK
jgi:hypothetical protein